MQNFSYSDVSVLCRKFDPFFSNKEKQVWNNTGCSDWKLLKVNMCRTEIMHFWAYVVKTKMCLRGGSLFERL